MNSDNVGFGIIGCGMIAPWHAKAIKMIDGAKLIGATDPNSKALEAFAREYGIYPFETAEQLFASRDIDAVCICTPSGLHAPLAISAANAGKHIVVEKPMALSLREADAMIEACEKNNVKMEVISQSRFCDAVQRLKNAVDAGKLGRLVTGDVYIKYHRSREYYASAGWRGTRSMDGGALLNQGIHGVDLLRYIMGPVKSVFANAKTLVHDIEAEDTLCALLEYESGALGVIQTTTSLYAGWPRRLEICGADGSVVIEEDCISAWSVKDGNNPDNPLPEHTAVGAASNPMDFSIECHLRQLGDMTEAIRRGGKPLVDPYEGRKTIELIEAIYESAGSGKRVAVKDIK